jgi:hypothetical protein
LPRTPQQFAARTVGAGGREIDRVATFFDPGMNSDAHENRFHAEAMGDGRYFIDTGISHSLLNVKPHDP